MRLKTASEIYRMLGNESVWKAAHDCTAALAKEEVPHAVLGGVAVCLHGYQRNTVDVDLLVRREDSAAIQTVLTAAGFAWNAKTSKFIAAAGTPIHLRMTSEPAGKGSEVPLPDPDDSKAVSVIEGMMVHTLAKLIESKLACGDAEIRRSYKDFADVVELIACNGLDGSFARKLHKAVRPRFRDLLRMARA